MSFKTYCALTLGLLEITFLLIHRKWVGQEEHKHYRSVYRRMILISIMLLTVAAMNIMGGK